MTEKMTENKGHKLGGDTCNIHNQTYEVYKELVLINEKGKRNEYKLHRRGSPNGSSMYKNRESH